MYYAILYYCGIYCMGWYCTVVYIAWVGTVQHGLVLYYSNVLQCIQSSVISPGNEWSQDWFALCIKLCYIEPLSIRLLVLGLVWITVILHHAIKASTCVYQYKYYYYYCYYSLTDKVNVRVASGILQHILGDRQYIKWGTGSVASR